MNAESLFPFLKKLPQKNRVYYDQENRFPGPAEELYARVRTKEKRMYSDDEVRNLPELKNHPHSEEWKKRSRSAKRLWDHFEKKPGGMILDIGCGNGWFTHRVAGKGQHSVLGLDMNIKELEQAARLFSSLDVSFLYGNLFSSVLPNRFFTYIIVGAAIQYFPDLTKLLDRLLEVLAQGGEIHLFDSPLYTSESVANARKRSKQYYTELGFPEMADHYYHHVTDDLKNFNFEIMYYPERKKVFRSIFGFRDMPFPWIRILKDSHEKEKKQ